MEQQKKNTGIYWILFLLSTVALIVAIDKHFEYLTLILTISFLPWELYELARKPDWFRLNLLVINLAVLGYLVWLLRRKKLLGGR